MMGIDMQIALSLDLQVDHAVARHLVEHVIEERDTGGEPALAAAIEIETNENPGFEGISTDFGLPHEGPVANGKNRITIG
jgi:hypothetical protein